MARRRFLISAWPWRAAVYLLTGCIPGTLGLAILTTTLIVGGVLSAVLIGLPMLAAVAFVGVPIAGVERWRLRLIDPRPIEDPHRPPHQGGVVGWVRTRAQEAATWRELVYTLLLVTLLWPLDLAAVLGPVGVSLGMITAPAPVLIAGGQRELWPGMTISTPNQALIAFVAGLPLLIGAVYAITAFAVAQGALARKLLAPRDYELRGKLDEITRSRARLLKAFDAERRRIERDLHDGAQQQLTALSVSLGLARLDLLPGPAADHIAHAHQQAKRTLTELRDLIHGIYPQVLTQRGLVAAVQDAADRCAVPLDVAVHLDRKLPLALETTGYFVVCEAISNIIKHSQATRGWIHSSLTGDTLVLRIGDDGIGGADPSNGSGLTGLIDRSAIVGGTVILSSPTGGPTLLTVELPCPPTGAYA
ncbi:sensor histidine kinase [Frankia sp. Cas3]|uniref:sensor histidine kinase n=1 Tax=Frankia sp. Cas3 TaxID=3073926 RepID=UPI002AD5B002|nr:sensor domain-containing protein [Frankia sp. Cas3]